MTKAPQPIEPLIEEGNQIVGMIAGGDVERQIHLQKMQSALTDTDARLSSLRKKQKDLQQQISSATQKIQECQSENSNHARELSFYANTSWLTRQMNRSRISFLQTEAVKIDRKLDAEKEKELRLSNELAKVNSEIRNTQALKKKINANIHKNQAQGDKNIQVAVRVRFDLLELQMLKKLGVREVPLRTPIGDTNGQIGHRIKHFASLADNLRKDFYPQIMQDVLAIGSAGAATKGDHPLIAGPASIAYSDKVVPLNSASEFSAEKVSSSDKSPEKRVRA